MTFFTKHVLKELIWLALLTWGFLLMIAAVSEGFPYTSIKVRGDTLPTLVGSVGFLMSAFGVYIGFSIGNPKGRRRRWPNQP
jgi:hypothetical protein